MTMRKRDKDIIRSLEKHRCLSRDQVAELFFSDTKNATTNANTSLKRLRDRGYIDANVERQPFVYFPKPTGIKKDGNKVDHFLKIADVYIQLLKLEVPEEFDIEPRYDADVRPDIFTIIKRTPFFIEVQNSFYSQKVMQKKINLYREYFMSGEYTNLSWQRKDRPPVFPYIVIISKNHYKLNTDDSVHVFQYKSIDEFVDIMSKQ
jgi:hypothetical protein